jgi:hypothetical protein
LSILAHEIVESVTDETGLVWVDGGSENADMCNWNFGTTYKTATGADANVKVNLKDYLIQTNWLNGVGCVNAPAYTAPATTRVVSVILRVLAF